MSHCIRRAKLVIKSWPNLYRIWTNSLGLISDSDCMALGMGLFASVMAIWPADKQFTFGYVHGGVETLSGFANGVFLMLISVFIVFEAVQRLVGPPEMNTNQLLTVSFMGLMVNLVGMFVTNHHHHHHHHHHHGHSHGNDHDHALPPWMNLPLACTGAGAGTDTGTGASGGGGAGTAAGTDTGTGAGGGGGAGTGAGGGTDTGTGACKTLAFAWFHNSCHVMCDRSSSCVLSPTASSLLAR
ncbi:hypothetical protein PSTG_02229 [Puccinia striiformis f. sp. tritici PST-78]|uniref:Cation efflux protein transmembrane domain-containing protein n=1 Tax=Puccinia striiformis f. sp. tritici PST-78 TaxID=1165861 RepID=A0A0L0VZN6_9BASI|nr:hypothetical protein PSTG_02229 [Puccinia striiformis f. sp. tritici PST-78]